MKQTILITGGAGYIGSHTVLELISHNYRVVVIDRACTTTINHEDVIYFQCDIADAHAVASVLTRYVIHGVIHCAASIEVGVSVVNPAVYYENNVAKSLIFFNLLRAHGIKKIVFSSSAAVYGIPTQLPIPETAPCNPINPYGKTKHIIEQLLADYAHAYEMQYVALRYFNAAGATPQQGLGEQHDPETHLIPRVIEAAVFDKEFTLFGTDYGTPDGTCVRDYVHVRDIARAHRLALTGITDSSCCRHTVNLGTAHGCSVQEIITAVEQVSGKKIRIKQLPRRAGDPAYLIADNQKARALLGWEPEQSALMSIIESAYNFYIKKSSYENKNISRIHDIHAAG